MPDAPEQHFPADFESGRSAFVNACQEAGLGVTTRIHPNAKATNGKPLYLDTARIGAREARKAMLLVSGTHGVEGYFGSGVQTGLLRGGLARRAIEGAKIVLVHALNPFGFAWNRRVNEDNADINRNFVEHAHPPANEAYEALADAIAPKTLAPAALQNANEKLIAFANRFGFFALQEAISRGQYRHADGLYFGGRRESWSAAMLKEIVREELGSVERLVVIDFHTGLGDCGAAEMITEHLPRSRAYARARKMWGQFVRSSEAGQSLSAPLSGTIDQAMATWMKGKELTFAALEVGTAPLRQVFEALRKDNWLHTHGGLDDKGAPQIKREIRAAFYPDTREWKRVVWRHAEGAVQAASAALA